MSAWKSAVTSAALLLALSPFARGQQNPEKPVVVNLHDAQGQSIGTATLSKAANGVMIKLNVENLSPGPHAIHVHQNAKCEGPDFKSAGGHFNPDGKHHGLENPEGPHAGDRARRFAHRAIDRRRRQGRVGTAGAPHRACGHPPHAAGAEGIRGRRARPHHVLLAPGR